MDLELNFDNLEIEETAYHDLKRIDQSTILLNF